MSEIIQLDGNLEYKITIDPSVWIFDDRKIELEKCFDVNQNTEDEDEKYTRAISEQWDRERAQGASFPPVNKSVNRKEKDKMLTGSFVMPFQPFIENAKPQDNVSSVKIIQKDGNLINIDFKKVKDAFLCFALNGKPLREDGPVHLYYRDGSNRNAPIKNIISFIFE